MSILASILSYIFLFLGLCLFVLLVMTLWNIVQKSYNRRSAILISLCFFLGFLVSAVLAVSSANRAIAILNNVVQNSPAGSNQGTRQGIKDGLY